MHEAGEEKHRGVRHGGEAVVLLLVPAVAPVVDEAGVAVPAHGRALHGRVHVGVAGPAAATGAALGVGAVAAPLRGAVSLPQIPPTRKELPSTSKRLEIMEP